MRTVRKNRLGTGLKHTCLLVPGTALVWAACAVLASTPARAQGLETIAGVHYEFSVQGRAETARELSAMCEAAWPELAKRLGCEPKLDKAKGGKQAARLRVKLFATKEDFEHGVLRDSKGKPEFTDPVWSRGDNQTVYARKCDNEYLTRTALLYGLFLQFHAAAKPKNKDLDSTWYISGMAHDLSIHRWDGTKLEMGVRPAICDIDYPIEGLKMLGEGPLPAKSITEDRLMERPIACVLMRFLNEGQDGKYKKRLEKLALGSTGSKVSGLDFLGGLGDLERVALEMQQYLRDTQLEFAIDSGSWEETKPGTIVASAMSMMETTCHLRREHDEFDVKMHIPVKGTSGIVVGWTAPGEYALVRYAPPKLVVERHEKGKLARSEEFPVPDQGADVVPMTLRRRDGKVAIRVFDLAPVEIDAPKGAFGLAAENGRAVFEGVRWR